MGRRHFARGGIYGYDLGCPYYPAYTAPYYCTYDY
jgi:hypothetical protein